MKKYIVYVHIFPNQKKYFGITSKSPNGRWEGGTGYSKSHQPIMYNAIKKYGWENVEHKILYSDLTYQEAIQKERELIKRYKTNCHKFGDMYGYNMTDGGDGASGHVVSDIGKRKMSMAKLGKTGAMCPNSKPVICDGAYYESLTQFRQTHNVSKNVSKWLSGEVAMPKEWYDKGLRYVNESNNNVRCQLQPWAKLIEYQGKTFKSQAELARHMGVSPATICKWIKCGEAQKKGINTLK